MARLGQGNPLCSRNSSPTTRTASGSQSLVRHSHSCPLHPHLLTFLSWACSDTTRTPRAGEEPGVAYHFTTRDDFLALVKADGFIENAEFSGNLYGTSVKAVEDVAKGDKTCILDIDTQVRSPFPISILTPSPPFPSLPALVPFPPPQGKASRSQAPQPQLNSVFPPPPQGVKLIKQHHAHLNPLYIFIAPPSLASLKSRLTGRGTESDSSLAARLAAAVGEVEYAKTGAFDVVVVNDDLDRAYGVLKEVVVDGKKEGDVLPAF